MAPPSASASLRIPSLLRAGLLVCAASLVAHAQTASPEPEPAPDPRTLYDVLSYDLELLVDPEAKEIEGAVTVHARALVDGLELLRLDCGPDLTVSAVSMDGEGLEVTREGIQLDCRLPAPLAKGAELRVVVRYTGKPRSQGDFDGFHWKESADGSPWIGTSCQGLGAHSWWPCKANYFHADDKPDEVRVALTVPDGLVAVSNGRLQSTLAGIPAGIGARDGEWQTWRWHHPYPLETYTVTANIGPYVIVQQELELEGLEIPVPFVYYVLPENVEKAAVQFAQVPELIRIFSEAFGPWPFPDSKIALVETSFWGMEHSTAVAYGSSYPAWCELTGARDPYARRNQWFDYILVHEMAHEWWGNAVSAEHWGHFWLHEGFGTYAEGVYVEHTRGREAADRWFVETARGVARQGERGTLYRGDRPTSGDAYAGLIYSKGAAVLNTLRHYVDDDDVWWSALRAFQLRHRYANATTEDFRAVLEELTQRSFEQFFAEWVYGAGSPALEGTVAAEGSSIVVKVSNDRGTFHVPLDVAWTEDGAPRQQRLWLTPGANDQTIETDGPPEDVTVLHLDRLLGSHSID